jgi:cytidine deaminase
MTPSRQELLDAARAARQNAVCTYSGFAVGAALLSSDGRVWTGCNVENATFGLTLCAERVALVKAVSEGVRQFRCVAVVADTPRPTPPCGPCRQLLWEFGGDLEVILGDLTAELTSLRLGELLPMAFDGKSLEQNAQGERGASAP